MKQFAKGAIGWIFALGLFVMVKLGMGCSTTQQQVIKDTYNQCVQPAADDAAKAYAKCVEQGGDQKWCLTHAAVATINFVECLWQKHLAGGCDKDCPFHTDQSQSPDGGSIGM